MKKEDKRTLNLLEEVYFKCYGRIEEQPEEVKLDEKDKKKSQKEK